MNLQEQIRKVLKEETNQGKYTNALEDLTEVYKNEDCVCDIKISYKPDEDTYLINVKVGNRDLDNKFNGTDFRIRNYINQLRRKIKEEVYDYFPISFFVTFSDTPKCIDYKNLKESKIVDNIKSFFGKKPLTKDDKLLEVIVKFIKDNYDIEERESSLDKKNTTYFLRPGGNVVFLYIKEFKKLKYDWTFAQDIHSWISDDRLLEPDSELMGKVFEKLYKKKVNTVFGYSRV
jgi:predicted house-cleaning noncanonical NTP pyrophosphatase (MazG superfamily)